MKYTLPIFSMIALCILVTLSCDDRLDDSSESIIPPSLSFFTTDVPEDTPIGSVIGEIEVSEEGDSPIVNFTLSENETFEVDAAGELRTKLNFNREVKSTYFLSVFASNEAGDSEPADLLIKITRAVRPQLGDLEVRVSETVEVGEIIGQVPVLNEGESPIQGFILSDEQHFEINAEGELITKSRLLYDDQALYQLEVSAINDQGEGKRVQITVHINDPRVNIPLCEDRPLRFNQGDQEEAPRFVTTRDVTEGLRVEWCHVSSATAYEVKHGLDENRLNEESGELSPGLKSFVLTDLDQGLERLISVSATQVNGLSRSADLISATPGSESEEIDLSIDRVTFNQSVQIDLNDPSNETPVIAHKRGVLRVFVNSDSPHRSLKAELKLGGIYEGTELEPIIKEVALRHSPFSEADSSEHVIHFELDDPAWLREGTSFYLELDPHNKIEERDESNNRYPSAEEVADFGFKEVPPLRIKLFSVVTNNGQNRGEVSSALINEVVAYLKSLYPISDIEVTDGGSLLSSTTLSNDVSSWSVVLNELAIKKNAQVSRDASEDEVFYFGVIDCGGRCSGLAGLATLNLSTRFHQLTGMGRVDRLSLRGFAEVLAHEVGHNHGRSHVNAIDERGLCGFPDNIDRNYPYNSPGATYGRIGKTGYDHREHRLIYGNRYHDMMSYCRYLWISDYTYKKLYDFQVSLYESAAGSKADQAEQIDGVMLYGELSYGEDGTLQGKIHSQQQLRWATNQQRETDFTATVSFADASEMKTSVSVSRLDHSDIMLFQMFVPTLKAIDTLMVTHLESGDTMSLLGVRDE